MKQKKKRKQITILSIILIIIAIVLIYGFDHSSARYTNETNWNHSFYTNGFYITSNLLNEDGLETVINDYDYSDFKLEVNNYEGEYKITNYDIDYQLKCEVEPEYQNDFSCMIDNKEVETVENKILEEKKCYQGDETVEMDETQCQGTEYEFKSSPNKVEHNIKLINKTNNQDINSVELTLTLTTTNPYQKTLVGKIVLNLVKDSKIQLDIKNENSRYCNILLTNSSTKDKNINLTVDSSRFQLDNSINIGTILEKNQTGAITKFNTTIKSASQIELKLFKKDENSSCSDNSINYTIQN